MSWALLSGQASAGHTRVGQRIAFQYVLGSRPEALGRLL